MKNWGTRSAMKVASITVTVCIVLSMITNGGVIIFNQVEASATTESAENSTDTPTPTPTKTQTATPTPTPTSTETQTPTPTPTPTPTETQTPTPTPTPLNKESDDSKDTSTSKSDTEAGGRPPGEGSRVRTTNKRQNQPDTLAPPEKRFRLQSRAYTVQDLVFFGYRNNTNIAVTGETLQIDSDEIRQVSVSEGTYGISGSRPFAVLSGDPLSKSVSGYYATDQNGFPVSSQIKTWVPEEIFGNEKLIIFGYEPDTSVTVRNQRTGEVITTGEVDRGGHLELNVNDQIDGQTYVVIESDKPVSALTHFDQGYYVPAASNGYTGTEFHTYASSIAASSHEVVVSGFSNETQVEITNSETGAEIWTGTVDAGEVHSEPISSGTYISVETDAPATVSVQPYNKYRSRNYFHGLYVPSSSGSFIGSDFVEANTRGDHMFVFGYENDTEVTVIRNNGEPQTYTLDRGDATDVSQETGVYRIISDKPVSVHAGYSEFSAGFAPVEFGSAETGTITGTVRDSSGDLLSDQQVLVIPMTELYRVFTLDGPIDDESNIPETWRKRQTDDQGQFTITPVSPGRYVTVAINETDGNSRLSYRSDTLVTEGRTVRLNIQYQSPLSGLEDPAVGLRDDYQTVLNSNEEAAADVYVDGYDEFAGETTVDRATPDNTLKGMIDVIGLAAKTAQDVVDDPSLNPKKVLVSRIGRYLAENTVFAIIEARIDHIAIQYAPKGVSEAIEPNAREVRETEFLNEFRYSQSEQRALEEGYRQSEVHRNTVNSLDTQEQEVKSLVASTNEEEISDNFSQAATLEVLRTQRRMVNGDGPSPGVVITPNGDVYLLEQTRAYREEYYRAKGAKQTASQTQQVLDFVGTSATAVAVYSPEPTSKTAAASVATAATVGSVATEAVKLRAEYKMSNEYAKTQIYWAQDADDIEAGYGDTVSWLEEEVETPRAQAADGEVTKATVGGRTVQRVDEEVISANRPNYPLWAEAAALPALAGLPQYGAEKESTITVKNTGESPNNARVVVVNYNGEDGKPSEYPSIRPGPSENAFQLSPGEERTLDVTYRARFRTLNPFEFHYQTVYLWADGQIVGQETTPYYIVPNFDTLSPGDVLSASSDSEPRSKRNDQPMRSDEFAYTVDSRGPVTRDSFAQFTENVTTVVDTELRPEQPSTAATVDLSDVDRTQNVRFVLVTESGQQVDLNVYDELNRHVGFAPSLGREEVQIPGAKYSGRTDNPERIQITSPETETFRVTANATEFVTDDPVKVQVFAVTEPERPAILGVTPGRVDTVGTTNQTNTDTLRVAEVGGQESITDIRVTKSEFTTDDGAALPQNVDVSLEEPTDGLAPGEDRSVDVVIDAQQAESVSDPGQQTRFDGNVTVETSTGGSLTLNTSVLLLDTTADELSLAGADRSVTGLRMTRASSETASSSELPENSEPLRQYEVDATGSGQAAVTVSDINETTDLQAYADVNGNWQPIETSSDVEGTRLIVPANANSVVVALVNESSEPTDTSGPSVPEISDYVVSTGGEEIMISFESDENLVDIQVEINGPEDATLNREDFDGVPAEGFDATYVAEKSGKYTVEMVSAEDAAGNDGTEDAEFSKTVTVNASDSESSNNETTTPADSPGTATPTAEMTPPPDDSGSVTPTSGATTSSGDPDSGTSNETEAEDDSTGDTSTATEEGGPGLGIWVALTALLGAIYLLRRRDRL